MVVLELLRTDFTSLFKLHVYYIMYMYIFVITQMLNFGSFDMKGKSSVLPCIQELMTLVYKPAMKVNENIGDLAKTPQGKQTYSRFLDTVDQFVQYLNSKCIFVHV